MNQVRSIEKSLKMNGVSRDGGTKKYTNKSNIKMYFYFHNMKTVRIYLVAISFSNIVPVCVYLFIPYHNPHLSPPFHDYF